MTYEEKDRLFVLMVGTIGIRVEEQENLIDDLKVYNETQGFGRYYIAVSVKGDTKREISEKLARLGIIKE